MSRELVISALLTGLFCAVFAFAVDAVMDMTRTWMVAVIALISGFAGRIFAHFMMGGR